MPEQPLRHRGLWIAVVAILAAGGLIAAVIFAVAGGSSGDPAGGPDADRVAELEAQEAARDAELIVALTEQATTAHGQLLPVIEGLHGVVPADGEPSSTSAPAADIAAWRSAVESAVATFGEPPSGSTDFNTARNGLLLSVDLLGSSVTAYEAAVGAGDDAEQRSRLQTLASDLRTQAVEAWSVAATQLDVLNIDAGHGHVHIYLPARPGQEIPDPHAGH